MTTRTPNLMQRKIRPRRPLAGRCRSRRAGLSLIELLIALAISAVLLTATMVAIDASFKAYASAAEQASTHASLRMVSHRLITLVRTSTAHGPLLPSASTTPAVTLSGNMLTSHFIELLDTQGRLIRVEYKSADQELWLSITTGGSTNTQPLMGGVTDAKFFLHRQRNDDGLWVLQRGTMDVTVQPGGDSTLQLETGKSPPIRLIASTRPRKLE